MNLLLVGFGKMGSSIGELILKANKEVNLYIVDPSLENSSLNVFQNINQLLTKFPKISINYIIFAIKPQNCDAILFTYKNIFEDATIITILAGKSISFFESIFSKERKIFRFMPNMAIKYGKSTSLLCKNEQISDKDLTKVKELLISTGEIIQINESDINYATIITSCMPAFVAEFIRHFSDYTKAHFQDIKNPENILASLLENTSTLIRNENDFMKLISSVASKGGVTEAGLETFRKNNLDKIIRDVIDNSLERTKIL